jgi:hypothetical protein
LTGSEALTQFGEDFFYSLDKLVSKCQRNRDRAVKQRSDLKEEQERLEQELRDLLDEQELKYKEHFVETDRSDIVEKKKNSKKSPKKDNKIMEESPDNFEAENLSILKVYDVLKETEIVSERKSRARGRVISDDNNIFESDEKLDLKSRGKWNDDTDCPVTFDNMDFIYTSANKGNIDEICSSDVDEIDIVTTGLRNVSCTPSETNEGPALESQKSFDVLPPVGQSKQPKKTKSKRNYTPNLVVPNRTLMLRRSGSLSKLNESSMKFEQLDSQENEQCENISENIEKTKLTYTRSRSSSKERRLIPQKPPFR